MCVGELESALQRAEEESWSAPVSNGKDGGREEGNGAGSDGMGYSMQGRADKEPSNRSSTASRSAKSVKKKSV